MTDNTPRRRSSRLHSRGATPSRIESTPSKLSSVLEREESPPNKLQNIDELVSTPAVPSDTPTLVQRYAMPGSFDTPPAAQRVCPGLNEMHPSKVHHSTVQKLVALNPPNTAPAVKETTQVTALTPSKSRGSMPAHMSSPGFDFSFTRPESDLSEEAQKIMDSVREEAARIKAQMQAEREKHMETGDDAQQASTPVRRKIANPNSGRYSDIHKQQFKKMDSIANHVSTWKTKIQSTVTAPTKSSSLKRSNSKAGLDQPESGIPRSKSFKALPKSNELAEKRIKRNHDDDASQTRPISRDADDENHVTPAKPHPTGLPSAVSTPTKASLARSASVKASKTSMVPSLSRSASSKTLGTPQTEGSNKYKSKIAKFSPVKSILHRSQPKSSDDPLKVAAGTHLPLPSKPLAFNKDLPSLPNTPLEELQRSPSVKKHVNFTPSTKPISDISPVASPSPSKIPRSESMKALRSPNITHRGKQHKIPNTAPTTDAGLGLPGDFTFSSSKTINFGPPTSGLTNANTKSKTTTSTIRAVRPSGFPTPLAETAFENHKLEAIPHGIGNKKRKQDQEYNVEDRENIDPNVAAGEDRAESPAKRIKVGEAETPVKQKVGMMRTPKSKGKGRMTLGRLTALAKPKA
ncbi:MAG: hypothetical protein Q9179_004648, partial [Wetmoreana sp. 5 TL-2023]